MLKPAGHGWRDDLVERAAAAGLRSFVGFETLAPGNLARSNKRQNLGRDHSAVANRLHDLGINDVATVVELHATSNGVRMVRTFDAMHDEEWTQRAVMGWESEPGKLGA